MRERVVRLVMPHQLFVDHLAAPAGTHVVLVEHDLLFRQYRFHQQKLVLHRASMTRFAARLRDAGYAVDVVESDPGRGSGDLLGALLRRLDPTTVECFDVVDDWLERDLAMVDTWLESPGFLTSRPDLDRWYAGAGRRVRMQHFYTWQRRRLGVLLDGTGPDAGPVGGRWSFDEENRKKLPRGHPVPDVVRPPRAPEVDAAISWVREAFPDNPGNAEAFAWPTDHAEASAAYDDFLAHRFDQFGPYEDAIVAGQGTLFHSLLTPALNIGLIDPRDVLDRALARDDVPLASLEGFVRQLIGWREYMRAVYVRDGRRLRSRNHLGQTRPLTEGWWTASTGLEPVDTVLARVLETGYAHHIERLMVLGNAMCLLRTDPEAAHEWFMEMFVDSYDWVMVPNVQAMSQFAAGDSFTTKPYVSGSNYLRKMSDFGPGEWREDWDALYWTFVRDHLDVFATNPRSRMVARLYDGLEQTRKDALARRAASWLA